MNLDYLIDYDWYGNYVLPLALLAGAIVVLLLFNWKTIHRRWLEWRSRSCLNRIGINQRQRVICADGLGGNFCIDRMAMLHDSIILIAFKPYAGNIYCAQSISEWTQILDQKSYKFNNPLFELEHQLVEVRKIVPGIEVRGFVFFDHSADFPKGHPDAVLHPGNIPEYFQRSHCPQPRAEILSAWESLTALPEGNEAVEPLHFKT